MAAFKDSKTIQKEHAEFMVRKAREAAAVATHGKLDRLKTVAAQDRFRNEVATATDQDMAAYYRSVPSARRP